MDDLSQPQTVGLLKKKRVNGKIVEDTPEETEGTESDVDISDTDITDDVTE